jgi:hypothetical protein
VVTDPSPECGPVEFGESAVIYALRYWIADFGHDGTIDEEVHARVWYAAQRAGLEIPYPTRTVLTEHEASNARAVAEAKERDGALRLLERTEPFSRLDVATRGRCIDGVRRLEFGRGEHVLGPDEPEDQCLVIHSGEIGVHLGSNGARREIATLRAGELVGPSLLPRHDACTARSALVVYRLDGRAVGEVVAANAELAAALSAIAGARQAALDGADGGSGVVSHHASTGSPNRLRRLLGRH